MISLPFDIYPLIRPLLFSLDPETAHHLAITALKLGLVPQTKVPNDPVLKTSLCGIDFAHPIGLAAGFDKQAEVMRQLFGLGFSSIEIGGVTPLPQPGNPKPRMFRDPKDQAVINRFGFNSIGADAFRPRAAAYYRTKPKNEFLGINLGKNKETIDAANDYVKGVSTFAPYADFLTINVSSPNTPGLRDMQAKQNLADILSRVMDARAKTGYAPRLFLKIAPDIDEALMNDIVEVSLASKINGLIVSNTTTSRPSSLPEDFAKETGGLSGKPLFEMSTRLLGTIYKATQGKLPLIGCGGVFSGADAYAKIRAGASLVQIYTALVFEGPNAVARILSDLAALLKRDGFASAREAIGAGFKLS